MTTLINRQYSGVRSRAERRAWLLRPGFDGAQKEARGVAHLGVAAALLQAFGDQERMAESGHRTLEDDRRLVRVESLEFAVRNSVAQDYLDHLADHFAVRLNRGPVVLHGDEHDVVHALFSDQVIPVVSEYFDK